MRYMYFQKCWILSGTFQKVGVRIIKLELKTSILEIRRTLSVVNETML